MTPYDAGMVGLIVAGMVWGACRGITWQVASLASLVLGYSISHQLSVQLAPHFPGDPVVARALAMLTVYFAVSGGVFLTAWMIRATLAKLKFEAFDRHLGMVLGGIEGAFLGVVLTLFVVSLAPQSRPAIFGSPTGKVVGLLMGALGPVLPEEARGVLAPFWSSSTEPLVDRNVESARAIPTPAPGPEPQFRTPLSSEPARRGGGSRDEATGTASFQDLIQESETRLGRAIVDGASRGLQKAAGGTADDGTIERR
ncbi:MAG: hypothetical protein NVSMB9_32360 [Isosphaeraceae bacterium]